MRLAALILVLLELTLVGAASVDAQSQRGVARRIKAHEHNHLDRNRHGRQNGELTRLESRRLLAEQARIRAEARLYRYTGGRIGPREALNLRRDLGRSSRHIYRQKHDAQSRI